MIVVVTPDHELVQRMRSILGADRIDWMRSWSTVHELRADAEIVVLDRRRPPRDPGEFTGEEAEQARADDYRGTELYVMGAAASLEEQRPDTTVVLYGPADPRLLSAAMRAGVRDILVPEASDQEIRDAIERALVVTDRRRQAVSQTSSDNRLIMVLSPKGGAGKTTVSSNLAVGLATRCPKQVVLVDGDLQFGDVGNALRLIPQTSVRDAVAGGLRDVTEVKVHLTPHKSGLYALCAPEVPGVADEITAQAFARAVNLLHQEFKYVVVDTDPGLAERTLAVMDNATDFVLIGATDVASVRGLRKSIEALNQIGMTSQRRIFVLNRSDAKVGLDVKDIVATIGMEPDITIPSSRMVPISMNQGVPVLENTDKTPATDPLWELVDLFEPRDATGGGDSQQKRGIFGRLAV